MAKMQKMEGQVELNCSAVKIFEMLRAKQPDIAKLCSHKVPSIEAHQGDWLSVGSTRKWDFIIGEKRVGIVDRIDAIDEEKMKISRTVTDGEIMSNYKTLTVHTETITKGNDKNTCIVKCSLEYEKVNEDAAEPKELLDFGIGVLKELGNHLSTLNN